MKNVRVAVAAIAALAGLWGGNLSGQQPGRAARRDGPRRKTIRT